MLHLQNQQTSLITILSSDHGRLRREQRDIDKRDLQKALKHGTRQRGWSNRWRVEYDGIVFITDNSMTREITAFPAPLSLAPTSQAEIEEHRKAKMLHDMRQELSKTHTVFVVDNSGSMLEKDIPLHRDRQTAAYTTTALDFVAEQLFNGTANNKDLVSLVEFGETCRVVFSHEPVSWVLFNKLLERRDPRGFQDRQSAKLREASRYDSNYLPALEKAAELLLERDHEDLALGMFFLSDGGPSDGRRLGLTPAAALRRMKSKTKDLSSRCGIRLSAHFVGFGSEFEDFSALQGMADAMNSVKEGSKAEFTYCERMANSIGEAASSLATSLTETRLAMLSGANTVARLTDRNVSSEEDSGEDMRYFKIVSHTVFDRKNGWVAHNELPPGACNDSNLEEQKLRKFNKPRYLAINANHCGRGVERIAYRSCLADGRNEFALGPMVAKETRSVELMDENKDFHRGFLETQNLAAYLAAEFNRLIQKLPLKGTPPILTFLPCSVLVVNDPEWNGRRGVLVEKMLDPSKWTKWNNNAGAVDGKIQHNPMDIEKEMAKLSLSGDLGAIEEGDSDEESDESDDDGSDQDPTPSDYLQAFSHFSYRYTCKKVLVCDLQGVYNESAKPNPTFELTDPAIHYASDQKKMVFGRTDKGKKGQQLFFDTHRCSRVCKFLALSGKNRRWHRDWRDADMFGLAN